MKPSEAETAGVFADLLNFSDDLFLDDQHQQLSTPQPPPTTAAKAEGGEEEKRPAIRQEEYEDDEDFLESFPEVTVDELRWVLNREGDSAIDNLDALLLSTTPESKPKEQPTAVSVPESAPPWWPVPRKKRTEGRRKKKVAFALFRIPTKQRRELPAAGAERRRCWHCAAEETPQWRAGPNGPKTLCNACGVRFKSGRLLPEYRPANSPTFSSELHSNSHRKVLEMRQWKDRDTTVSSPLSAAGGPASAAGNTRRREQEKEKGELWKP